MLVNIYRLKTPGAIFSLPVLVAILALPILFRDPEQHNYLLSWHSDLLEFFNENRVLNYFISVFFISLIAHQINNLVNRHGFYSKDTFLPGLIYVLCLCTANYIDISPILVAHLFVVLGLMQVFKLRRQEDAKAIMFMGAFFFSVASIFSPLLLILTIVPWIGLGIFRAFVWREWVLVILGMLIPAIYHLVFYYINFDTINPDLIQMSDELRFPVMNISSIGLYSWFSLLVLTSIFGMISVTRTQVVRFKKQTQYLFHLLWICATIWIIGFVLWDLREITVLIPLSIIIGVQQLHSRNTLVVNMSVLVWFIICLVNLWTGIIL